MEFSAEQIAGFLGGKVDGDLNAKVNKVARIEEGMPLALSFLANPKYTNYIYETESSIVIVSEDFKPEKEIKTTLVRVSDPYTAFASLLELYDQSRYSEKGVSDKASCADSVKLSDDVYIGDFTVIGKNTVVGKGTYIFPQVFIGDDVVIGENTVIFPGVKIMHSSKIGNNCRIHSGAVIGSDGFGFAPKGSSDYQKVPQIGNVILEDDVELGANITIDRATIGSTIIRKGVKLDNLIQIAHNVEIGENTVIAAQTGVSGSTKLGRNCMVGGQVGFAGHLNIANEVKIGAQAGLSNSIKEEAAIFHGTPAMPIRDFQRGSVHFRNFDKIVNRIRELEEQVKKLQEK